MKYAVERGSGAMTYIPSFTQINSSIEELIKEQTHRQHGDEKLTKMKGLLS
jgi:tRNA A58 N-methylase Trm61